jgi:hypothetical protein
MWESANNYNVADGSSWEKWAYQFMPATWRGYVNQYSKAHKLSMDYEMTPWKQDLIVNWKIQQWLNEWLRPDQIASMWNHWQPTYAWVVWDRKDKNGNLILDKNWKKIHYDTPAYVNKIMKNLGVNVWITGGNTITKAKLDTISARSWISVVDLKKMTNDQVNAISGNLYDKMFVWIKALPISDPDLDDVAKSVLLWEMPWYLWNQGWYDSNWVAKDAYSLIIKVYPEYKDQLDKSLGLWGWASVIGTINGQ